MRRPLRNRNKPPDPPAPTPTGETVTRGAVMALRGEGTVRDALGTRHEPIALLGEIVGGGSAFLVRDRASGELAVARLLKRKKGDTEGPPIVVMLRELDGSVPAPSAPCPNCGTALTAWAQKCTKCGSRLAAAPAAADLARREPGRYLLLGTLPVYGGGAVSFAMREDTGDIVSLHAREWLDADGGDHLVLVEAGPLESPPLPPTGEQGVIPAERTGESAPETPSGPVERSPAEPDRLGPAPASDGTTPAGATAAAPEPAATPAPAEPEDEAGHISELPTALIEIPHRANQGQLHAPTQWVKPGRPSPGALGVPVSPGGVAVPKVCPMCGSEYETDARFCPKDGSSLRPKGGTDPLIGQVIADRYHVLKRIGEGGMGRVYLAEHVRMGRMCALKVMRSALLNDDEAMARFAREASNAARILHPNVVAVFDYGEAEGVVYLVMEYVEGEPLSTMLLRERALPVSRALTIMKQVTDALVAAHEMGVVHRDLKPDNILISRRGDREVAKVVDFGIAKAIAESPHEALTRSGLVIGTPEFMSPEQLLGDPVDARTDLYSLGCILFLMLTGSQAAEAPTREAMLKRRLHELPPHPRAVNRALPPELDAIVVQLLASSADERFPSAVALREALEEVPAIDSESESTPTVVQPAVAGPSSRSRAKLRFETPLPGPKPPVRRGRRALVAGVVLLAAGAAAVPLIGRLQREDAPPTPPAQAARTDSQVVRPPVAGATTGATTSAIVRPPGAPPTGTKVATVPGAVVRPAPATPAPALPRPQAPRQSPAEALAVVPINAYASALTTDDVERVRETYPGMTREFERRWAAVFHQFDVSARVERPQVEIDGESAQVSFTLVTNNRDRTTGVAVESRIRQQATLARRGVSWVLVSLK